MSWVSPESLLWLLAAPAVFLLYLLRGRAKPMPTATAFLWRKAISHRSPWSRMRPWVSASWRAAVVALLVLAMATPMIGTLQPTARSFVIVLDATASMQSKDEPQTRFEAAKTAAIDQLARLGSRDRAAILVAGAAPEIRLRFTEDIAALTKTLQEATVQDATGDIDAAVQVADEMLMGMAASSVLVFTDSQVNKGERTADEQSGAEIQVRRFRFEPKNVGVTSIAARRGPKIGAESASESETEPQAEVLATLKAVGNVETVRFAWKHGGKVIANGSATFVEGRADVTQSFPASGVASLELMAEDDLPVDDRAGVSLNALGDAPRTGLAAGAVIQFAEPISGELQAPDGNKIEIKPVAGQAATILGPLDQVGVWEWRAADGTVSQYPVALLSDTESLLGRMEESESALLIPTGEEPAVPVQGWFFALALICWGGEWIAFVLGVTE